MNKIFPGKTLRPISYPYSREPSCKKSEKSLGRFSWKICHGLTNQPTNQHYQAWPQLTLRTVTWPLGQRLNVSTLHHANIYSRSSCLTCTNSTFIPFHLVNMSNLYIRHSKTIGQNCHFWPLLAITMLIMIIKDRFPRQETPFIDHRKCEKLEDI